MANMDFGGQLRNAKKVSSFNSGGYDLERIEDGIIHQELKDSLLCGICLGKHELTSPS